MSNDLVPSQGGTPAGGPGGDGFFPDRASEIRYVMQTDRGRYFREGLDRELAEINAGKALADNPEDGANMPAQPLAAHRSRSMLEQSAEGRELVTAWRSGPGGFDTQLDRAQRGAQGIIKAVGDGRHQRAFMARFDREVSERARYHIYNDLAQGGRVSHPPATADDLNVFGSTDVGAALLDEWGHSAAHNVGKIWARVARFRGALGSESDFETLREWYDNLHPTAIKAILRHLAN